jgi:hypothetical protein
MTRPNRSSATTPVQQFTNINNAEIVNDINELINDLNGQFVAFFAGSPTTFPTYTVALLPAAGGLTGYAFATDGRKIGEGSGSGTGVPVYYSSAQTAWLTFSLDQPVLS